MKFLRMSLFSVVFGVASAMPTAAAWLGNPAKSREAGTSALELLYDVGGRDLTTDTAAVTKKDADLDSRRFQIQLRRAVNSAVQVFGRVTPGTGRLALENSSFNPVLWGGGVGLQLSPPEPMGPIHVGVVGAWDWTYGKAGRAAPASGDDSVSWLEGSAALGGSYPVIEGFDVFAGLSLVKAFIDFDIAGTESDWDSDKVFGGFLGAQYVTGDSWVLGADLRFANETVFGLSVGYGW